MVRGTTDATTARMASKQHTIGDDPGSLPKQGPAWTFYAFAIFALLTIIAIIYGFIQAGALR